MSREALLVIGVIFHIVYLYSIFDIYFTSPLVHGMASHKSPVQAPAERLVLFVGDGLRADKLFELDEQKQTRAPFLRGIMTKEGAWGVSHTRVPTESRPGHVAIIAGFYEDVSAVTTGWTMNPVNFDSVFNRSQHTWSFGSPDILPMFQHGASDPSRIDTFMYPPEFEDFSGEASHLDTWVFDHVKAMFHNATNNPLLNAKLRENKIVFFLHLLGLDTNGHGFRPHSKEYCDNIKLVDKGVEEMTRLIEDFYGHDGKTSYVFTADHGMNNRGGHGDGHPDNTRTPLIAWGAGIRKPLSATDAVTDTPADWHLDGWHREDVNQADIAPLMAHLIGIDLPVNSVGVLPLNYLKVDDYSKAEATFANARQILAQYKAKHDEKQQHELMFRPFQPLSGNTSPHDFMAQIQSHIDAQEYTRAESLSRQLMSLCLDGLRYFQTYDWLFLRSVVTAGFVGWCMFCVEFVIRQYVLGKTSPTSWSNAGKSMIHCVSAAVFLGLAGMIYVQNMPAMYYAYCFFPAFFWHQVVLHLGTLTQASKLALHYGLFKSLMAVCGTIIWLEALVSSYFHREVLTCMFVLMSVWPLTLPREIRKKHVLLFIAWTISCWSTSVFTLLPVEKGEDISLVICGGALGLITGKLAVQYLQRTGRVTQRQHTLMHIQLLVNVLSIILVYLTSSSLQRHEGLPLVNQVSSWIIISISSLFPFVYRGAADEDYMVRLLSICFAFAPLMTLLSISYEMLFYVCFCVTVLLWLQVERALYTRLSTARPMRTSDGRAVLFFLFFINVAFFGTGNVASMGSFSLESVYRFVTIFNPFLMGTLLITKVLIPFFVVSAVLGVLATSLELPPFSLFLGVMSVTDVQTINFFYFVSDFGSWLEIGTTISHYCIAELFIIFTIVLFWLSRLLVGHLFVPKLAAPFKAD